MRVPPPLTLAASKSVRSGIRHGKLHIVCQYCKAAGRDRRPVFFTVIPDCEGLHRYRDRDRKRLSNKGNSGNKRRTVELDSQGVSPMADEQDRTPSVPDNPVVRRLIKEAHITEQQARDLIAVLGYDWPSLMREARFLTRKR